MYKLSSVSSGQAAAAKSILFFSSDISDILSSKNRRDNADVGEMIQMQNWHAVGIWGNIHTRVVILLFFFLKYSWRFTHVHC